jgi:hypothetical protein
MLLGVVMSEKTSRTLDPCEGLSIEEENNPPDVRKYFANAHVARACYGKGHTTQEPILVPRLRPSSEYACGLRAGKILRNFVYLCSSNDKEHQRE